jgi:RHS repeat-associated protein
VGSSGEAGILVTPCGQPSPRPGVDNPSGTLISERGPGGEFYYVTDGLGSTVALVDTTGTVQATYSYDPYGNSTTVGGPNPAIAGGNPFRYAGGHYDTTTGLYHFGQRYYNPTTGRWTQQDSLNTPLDPANGNRYAYTGDNPTNGTDPTGLSFLGIDCPFGNVDGGGSGCRGADFVENGGGASFAGALTGVGTGCAEGFIYGSVEPVFGNLGGCVIGASINGFMGAVGGPGIQNYNK